MYKQLDHQNQIDFYLHIFLDIQNKQAPLLNEWMTNNDPQADLREFVDGLDKAAFFTEKEYQDLLNLVPSEDWNYSGATN